MGFISSFETYIKTYMHELVLTMCMFSNLYQQLPIWLYYIDWAAFAWAISKYSTTSAKSRNTLVRLMISLIVISTLLSGIYEYRFIMMCIILYLTLARTSFKFYQFKVRFFFVSMIGYVFTSIINFYAHLIGYNTRAWSGLGGLDDFAGFTSHGLWLSAACGIANIYILYKIYNFWSKGARIISIIYGALLLISMMVNVWAGSRSGTAASVLAMSALVLLITPNVKKSIKILIIASMIGAVAYPIYRQNASRMIRKNEYAERIGQSSRDILWAQRLEEFRSSPYIGVGFGVYGVGENTHGGRTESGSGWLAVLAQTGIIGLALIIMIVKRGFLPISVIRKNQCVALMTSILLFLTVHTMFEGYLFQSGWYLCFVIYLVIGILDDYRRYGVMEFDDYVYF